MVIRPALDAEIAVEAIVPFRAFLTADAAQRKHGRVAIPTRILFLHQSRVKRAWLPPTLKKNTVTINIFSSVGVLLLA
jgi:hypothetical protein